MVGTTKWHHIKVKLSTNCPLIEFFTREVSQYFLALLLMMVMPVFLPVLTSL